MRLQISRSAKAASFYVTEGFRNASGKVTSRIVEKLGTEAQLREKLGEGIDVEQWAKDYVAKLLDGCCNVFVKKSCLSSS